MLSLILLQVPSGRFTILWVCVYQKVLTRTRILNAKRLLQPSLHLCEMVVKIVAFVLQRKRHHHLNRFY